MAGFTFRVELVAVSDSRSCRQLRLRLAQLAELDVGDVATRRREGSRGASRPLAGDANVESEEQKWPRQDCCGRSQHPAHSPERIKVVVDCGDDDADDDPDKR
jgi:hypothetical protein